MFARIDIQWRDRNDALIHLRGAVTLATNMAGRGVDIILGGNPAVPAEASAVREGGGLRVILWSTDAKDCREARAAIEALKRCLDSIEHGSHVQWRAIEPYEFCRQRGWPVKNTH